jgi:hypothetical protein
LATAARQGADVATAVGEWQCRTRANISPFPLLSGARLLLSDSRKNSPEWGGLDIQ